MFRKLGLVCVALAFFSMAGGHFAALQTIAWAKMLRESTQRTGSLTVAAAQTFDGAHLCELCLQIAAAKRQELKAQAGRQKDAPDPSQTVKAEKNDKGALAEISLLPERVVSGSLSWPAPSCLDAPSRAEQPPTPPPRAFRA